MLIGVIKKKQDKARDLQRWCFRKDSYRRTLKWHLSSKLGGWWRSLIALEKTEDEVGQGQIKNSVLNRLNLKYMLDIQVE